jgi:hypothetical protein
VGAVFIWVLGFWYLSFWLQIDGDVLEYFGICW